MDNKKIIIADDNIAIANLTKEFIEKNSNYKILDIAKSSKEEIEMIEKYSPDIIITDVRRNGEDISGLDIILKYEKNNKNIKFILVTACDKNEIMYMNNFEMPSNIIGYLRKPFEWEKIIEIIQESNVLVDNENNSVLVDNDESWKDKYYNTPSIDIKEEFTQEELDILSKLKIDYEDKVYTIYEYDLMKQKFYEYYYKKQDEWKMRRYKKSLHSVGVSIKEYEILVRKIEILDEKYYKNII